MSQLRIIYFELQGHNAKSLLVNNSPSEEVHGAKLITEDMLSSEVRIYNFSLNYSSNY